MQARFTKGSLCQSVLTSSFDKIIGFPDKGNLVDLIYLEFNKAFDMGPHGKLLVRLEKMRINRTRGWPRLGWPWEMRMGERMRMRMGARRARPEAGSEFSCLSRLSRSSGSGSIAAGSAGQRLHREMAMSGRGTASCSSSSSSSHGPDSFQRRLRGICDQRPRWEPNQPQNAALDNHLRCHGKGRGLNPSQGMEAALSSQRASASAQKAPAQPPKAGRAAQGKCEHGVQGTGRGTGGDDFIEELNLLILSLYF